MANTFIKIQTVTVGSGGAATIAFTSIPQTYTDLKLLLSSRGMTNNGTGIAVSFNGLTTNFTGRDLSTNVQNPPGSGIISTGNFMLNGNNGFTASVFGSSELYICGYATANNKPISDDGVTENNATLCDLNMRAGLWSNSAAITSITLTPEATVTFAQHSTATLYGIKSS